MPRARFIHPEAPGDPDFAHHSLGARLFFFYVLTIADDAGNFTADTRELKAKIYPYDNDIGPMEIAEFLQSLTEDSTYIQYIFGKYSLYHIRNFTKYQRPDYPTAPKYPLFPGQIHTYYAKEKGKTVKKTAREKDHNLEVFGEYSASILSQGREGKVVTSQPTLPTEHTEHTEPPPTADPDRPGPASPDSRSAGPTEHNHGTPLDYTRPDHWRVIAAAETLGYDVSSVKTIEKLTQLIKNPPKSKEKEVPV